MNRSAHATRCGIRRFAVAPAVVLASQSLKVASAFDDLTEGEADRSAAALEALYSSPGYVYNSRALEALERILDRDGRVRRR